MGPVNYRQFELKLPPTLVGKFLFIFLVTGMMYVLVTRLYLAATLPLWLDETWSAMIATRSTWSDFWLEAWLDCNPPLYYVLLRGWITMFGDSNFALRILSVIFALMAALMPVLWRPDGMSRASAWTFAALLTFTQPTLLAMVDARGYGLLLALSTASCLVFTGLLRSPTFPRAATWVVLGTLMFLTHYYAGVLAIGQAIVLLFRHGKISLSLWPTSILAIPGVLWLFWHLPRLEDYARKDVTWYKSTTPFSALEHLMYVISGQHLIPLIAVLTLLMILTIKVFRRADCSVKPPVAESNLLLTSLAAMVGFIIAITIGLFQESLTNRYFIPLIPPTMIGLSIAVQRTADPLISGMMLAFMFLCPSLDPKLAHQEAYERADYGFEIGSDFISQYTPTKLLFFWDHPAGKILDHKSLANIGSYNMMRQGIVIPTRAFVVSEKVDPNSILKAAATGARPSVIWLYDTSRGSSAKLFPPDFGNNDEWKCQDTSRSNPGGRYGAIACVKLKELGIDRKS